MIRKTLEAVVFDGAFSSPVFAVCGARQYKSDIFYLADGVQYDAKSIVDMTKCCGTHPDSLEVLVMGDDEELVFPGLFSKSE